MPCALDAVCGEPPDTYRSLCVCVCVLSVSTVLLIVCAFVGSAVLLVAVSTGLARIATAAGRRCRSRDNLRDRRPATPPQAFDGGNVGGRSAIANVNVVETDNNGRQVNPGVRAFIFSCHPRRAMTCEAARSMPDTLRPLCRLLWQKCQLSADPFQKSIADMPSIREQQVKKNSHRTNHTVFLRVGDALRQITALSRQY
jgi:hypothetical protein